jgi:hypothetical protein
MVSVTINTTNNPYGTQKLGSGDIPRSKYMRRAIESYLKAKGSGTKSGN